MFRSGSPVPIEYLPAENSLSSKVRLMILYQGRPTTTIAVGDPLTFRIESQDGYYMNDIFATNVIARDPYSGRSVQLIDRFGYVFTSYYENKIAGNFVPNAKLYCTKKKSIKIR